MISQRIEVSTISSSAPARFRLQLPGHGEPERERGVPQVEALSATSSWREIAADMGSTAETAFVRLSPAERVVTAYLCRGLTNCEIARALGKSEFTVKHQVSAILAKVGVPTRTRLIALLR